MTRCCFSLLAVSLLLHVAIAQTTTDQSTVPTLKISSRLVAVDVVVTDKKGRPVHNLKPSDFTLTENGQPQTMSHVDEHTPETVNASAPLPKLPPGTFTNFSVAPGSGALNIVLLDSLNTPLADQAFVRQEIIKYLKGPAAGSRMAIFGLASQLHLLQGFTSDPDVLRAAVNGKKSGLEISAILSGQISKADEDMTVQNSAADAGPGQSAFIQANYAQFVAERSSYELSLRIRVTLESLNAVARYLSGIPGRKNLIWFSGAFPLNMLPNGDVKFPFAAAVDLSDQFRETSDLLARSQVSVYPIDARGVEGMADPNDPGFNNTNGLAAGLGGNGAQESLLEQRTGGQSTMLLMAENTGGKAYINSNDLKQSVDKAIQAGSNYYTLAYTPADRDWKGEYRKIEVKLAQQGFTLSYRRGYFADDPDSPPASKSAATERPITTFDPMRAAMLFGGPNPSEIVFSASIHPVTGTPENDVASGNKAESGVSGPYVRYNIVFKADAKAITATVGANGRHLNVGFLTFVYNDKGKLINTAGTRVETDIPEDKYQAMLTDGIAYQQEISVPVKGDYFLRIGVNDHASNRVGSVEIPVATIARLRAASTP